jgi:hypothetical protein
MTAKPRKDVDWAAVENAYRAGIQSNRQIGDKYGTTEGAIRKRAKKEGWTKDLAPAVRQRAKQMVRGDGTQAPRVRTAADDDKAVEQEALVAATVMTTHRKDIRQGREMVMVLLGELTQVTKHAEAIEDDIYEETAGEKNPARRNAMLKAVSLGGRAGTIRDLSNALARLIPLERQAFNLDDKEGGDDLAAAILALKHG